MTAITDLPPARRPGPSAWARLVLVEWKVVWRDPGGVIVPIGLPLIILVMNGLGADDTPIPELGGLTPFDAFVVPLTLAMILGLVGMVNMPAFLATYRKEGVLRRLATTPAHPAMLLTAQVIVSLAHTLVGVAVALVVARSAFDLSVPAHPGVAVAVFVLACAATYAVGMLITAIAPTPNSAIAIGLAAFLATMALGGGFGDPANLPAWLETIGAHLPYGAGADALSTAWMGETPDASRLAALGVTAAGASVAAAALFRWE